MSVYYAYLDPNGLALAGKHIFADWDKLTKFYMAHGQKATVKKCNSLEEAEEFLGLPTELQAGKVC